MRPKPPPCNRKSTVLKACSTLPAHLTHSSLLSSISAATAEAISKQSVVSIKAQVSSLLVAVASVERSRLVFPHDCSPITSVMHPQGMPPKRSLTSRNPVEINRASWRVCKGEVASRATISPIRSCLADAALTINRAPHGGAILRQEALRCQDDVAHVIQNTTTYPASKFSHSLNVTCADYSQGRSIHSQSGRH